MDTKTESTNRITKRKSWYAQLSLWQKIALLLVVIGLGWFTYSKTLGVKTAKTTYQTASAEKGTIISTVSMNGNVASTSQAGVGSPTTGIIEEVYVKNGDQVNLGQKLFKVKSIATAQEIASAWASYQNSLNSQRTAEQNKMSAQISLEQARAAVISASTNVTTMNNNIGGSIVNPSTKEAYTQNDIDVINSTLTSAQETFTLNEKKYKEADLNISAVKASVQSAWLSYEATQDSVVTAPISGTIANINVTAGDQITASSGNLSSTISTNTTSTSNTTVLSIGNYTKPYIKVQASEIDVPNIKSGQKATITLDAFSDKTFVGTVDQVDTVGSVSSGVVTYNVFVSFVSPISEIKPGMSASVAIQTNRKDDVLVVPSTAVSGTGDQATVQVMKKGQVSTVNVVTGITSDSQTEIVSGLSEGDTVVTGSSSTGTTGTSSSGTSPFSAIRGGGNFGGGNVIRVGR